MKYYCPYCNKEEEYYIEKRIFSKYKGVTINIEEKHKAKLYFLLLYTVFHL